MLTVTIWNLFRSLAGLEHGVWCRRCAEPVLAADPFGRSERVCRACRHGAAA